MTLATWFLPTVLVVGTVAGAAPAPEHRPVVPGALREKIRTCDRLQVLESLMNDAKVLVEITSRADIEALAEASRVKQPTPEEEFHCMCIGTPAIRLFRKGRQVGWITHHHGVSLRCPDWTSDAVYLDPEAMLRWFDSHGIPGPRKEVEADEAQRRLDEVNLARWRDRMPTSLKPHWEAMARQPMQTPDYGLLETALAAEFPERRTRILALLAWYGSGAGPWSGYPAYEATPEEMLSRLPFPEILAAVAGETLTPALSEGLARFLCTLPHRGRDKDLAAVPEELKASLLKYVRGTITQASYDRDWAVQDKWGRAAGMLGPPGKR